MDNPDEKKTKRKTREDSVAETLASGKNTMLPNLSLMLLPKGQRKGVWKGKGGPENSQCCYRGVRKRTWDKWVAEIREPNSGKRLWLGPFDTAVDAASAYDKATRTMYVASAWLNFPNVMSHTFLMEFAKECCLSSSELGPYSMGSPVGSKSITATNPSEFLAKDAPYYPISEVVWHQVVW